MSVEEFRNCNDDDYLRWVADHHRGYVLNIQRTCNPHNARLHLAHCETIRDPNAIPGRAGNGTWPRAGNYALSHALM